MLVQLNLPDIEYPSGERDDCSKHIYAVSSDEVSCHPGTIQLCKLMVAYIALLLSIHCDKVSGMGISPC